MVSYPTPITYPGPGLFPVSATEAITTGVFPPTLTGFLDWNPTPRVQVVFPALDPRAATITIWRQATSRSMPVRGAINLPVAGGAAIVDLEAPFGVPMLYVAQQFDIDGTFIGNTGTGQITLDAPDTWVQNPFNPAGAIRCRVGIDTGQQVGLGVTLNAVYPSGRRAGIGIGGQRYGIPNVPVTLYADTLEQSTALDGMFGPVNGELGLPPFLVVRFAAKIAVRTQLPQPLIVGVPNPSRTLVNAASGGTVVGWNVSGPELDPPAAALAQAVYSRDDMDAAFTSRVARDAAYLTRLDMDTDYRHAGAATGGSPDSGIGGVATPAPASPTGVWGDGVYGDGVYGTTPPSS